MIVNREWGKTNLQLGGKYRFNSSKFICGYTKLLFKTRFRENLDRHIHQIKQLFFPKLFSKFHPLLCWGIDASLRVAFPFPWWNGSEGTSMQTRY